MPFERIFLSATKTPPQPPSRRPPAPLTPASFGSADWRARAGVRRAPDGPHLPARRGRPRPAPPTRAPHLLLRTLRRLFRASGCCAWVLCCCGPGAVGCSAAVSVTESHESLDCISLTRLLGCSIGLTRRCSAPVSRGARAQVVATFGSMMPRGSSLLAVLIRAVIRRHLHNLYAPRGALSALNPKPQTLNPPILTSCPWPRARRSDTP
jgi:hypothetical protein